MGSFIPSTGGAGLSTRVRRAVEEAPRTFDPEDGDPFQNHVWACGARAAFEGVHDHGGFEGRAVAQGFRHAIDLCRDFELEANAGTPFARLAKIVEGCAMTMLMCAGVHAKRELDN